MRKTQKARKNFGLHQSKREKMQEEAQQFSILMSVSQKVQCHYCKRDISKACRLVGTQDYCVSCFANLEDYPKTYHSVNKLDFPLFDPKWSAEDELLLFQGLQKHGFGNWEEIAQYLGIGKTPQEIQSHYLQTYLQSSNFLPKAEPLSKRDSHGILIKPARCFLNKKTARKVQKNSTAANVPHIQKGSITINKNHSQVDNSSKCNIYGYQPKRGDFEVEYENDAEVLLAQLQFYESDNQEQRRMKFRIIQIYNQKLSQRIRRKEFVLDRNLLNIQQQIRLDKARPKEEKYVYGLLKAYSRFSTAQDHQKIAQAMMRQRELRKRIQDLKKLKAQRQHTISEAEASKQETKSKKSREMNEVNNPKAKKKQQAKHNLLSKDQEEFCEKKQIPLKTYHLAREVLIREADMQAGVISKNEAFSILKINPKSLESILDFLHYKNVIRVQDH